MNNARTALVRLLEQAVEDIARCEVEAEKAIRNNSDQASFESWMIEKTEIVAGLAEKARKTAQETDGALGDPAATYVLDRLERYSASAETALDLNSPFYMSALLYPETHKPGEPNNLELVLEKLRSEN